VKNPVKLLADASFNSVGICALFFQQGFQSGKNGEWENPPFVVFRGVRP